MKDIQTIYNEINEILTPQIEHSINANKKEVEMLPDVLYDGEHILHIIGSYRSGEVPFYVCTDKRVIYLQSKIFNSRQGEIPLNTITGVDFSTGMMFSTVQIHTGSKSILIQNCLKQAAQPFANAVKEALNNQAQANSSTASSIVSESVSEQLFKLADLVEKGLLSKEEFNDQKQKILNN